MSEKIVKARCQEICDLCGRWIEEGERCRMIRDDFLPFMVFFEHLRCPDAAPAAQPPQPSTKRPAAGLAD